MSNGDHDKPEGSPSSTNTSGRGDSPRSPADGTAPVAESAAKAEPAGDAGAKGPSDRSDDQGRSDPKRNNKKEKKKKPGAQLGAALGAAGAAHSEAVIGVAAENDFGLDSIQPEDRSGGGGSGVAQPADAGSEQTDPAVATDPLSTAGLAAGEADDDDLRGLAGGSREGSQMFTFDASGSTLYEPSAPDADGGLFVPQVATGGASQPSTAPLFAPVLHQSGVASSGTLPNPFLPGPHQGQVVEDDLARQTDSGNLLRPGFRWSSAGTQQGTYGSLTVDAQGHWVYQLDNGATATQQLGATDQTEDVFSLVASDGSVHEIRVSVHGTNDQPVITNVAAQTVAEGAALMQGQLAATDVDQGAILTFTTTSSVPGFVLHADGSYSFNPADGAFDQLAVGQKAVLNIPVTVTDEHQAAATQTLTITVTGTNDVPVVNAIAAQSAHEDAAAISGQVTGSDVDAGDTLTYSIASQVDGLTLNTDGSWSFDPSHATYQSLPDGQQQVINVDVTGTDQQGASSVQTLTITVTGTNDVPTVTTALTDQATDQGSAFSFGVPAGTFADIDSGDTLTLTTSNLPAWLSFDATTGTFTGTPANSDVGTTQITVTATDSHGATVTSTFDLVVNNINDAPVLDPISQVTTVEDGAQIIGQITSTDIDVGDTATYSTTATVPGFTLNADGSYTFDPSNAAYQSLAEGDPKTLTIAITVTDAAGATDTQNLVIQLTGTNDIPTLSNIAAVGVHEDDAVVSGHFSANDPDAGDKLVFSTAKAVDGFLLLTDGSYSFDPGHVAYQSLPDGQQLDLDIPITVTDLQGASVTKVLHLSVTGTNDVPTVSAALTDQATDQGSAFSFGVPAGTFADIDSGDTLTLSTGSLPAWLSFDAITGTFTGTPQNSDVGTTSITVTATDSHGASVTSTFDLVVNNINDAPVLDPISQVTTVEDGALVTGQITATDIDTGDVLSFSTTASVPGFTLNSDGSYTFDPSNAAYQSLAEGDPKTLTIAVTVTDAAGATDTQNLIINLTGSNDAPVVNSIAAQPVHEDAAAISGQITGTDVDTGDTITYSIASPVDGLTVNTDGSWSFDPSHAAYQSLPDGQVKDITVTITGTDQSGATDTQDLVIHLTGTNDIPVITGHTSGVVVEDNKLSVSGRLSITDADAGESVFQAGTLQGQYGELTLDANGAWTYGLDNSLDAVQQLMPGEKLIDFVTVQSFDGTPQDIRIQINGTNDKPRIDHAASAQTATEDVAFTFALPADTFADTDIHDTTALSVSGLPAWLHFDAATGQFSGTPTNADVGSIQITVKDTDSFGAQISTTFNLTVNNVNDPPVLSPVSTQNVDEGGAQ
ncbi:VCBS domain-containing protein, partial [Pseudomaricurvus sp. HS19]|uniref:VCBS domain-containing protein n=1 Tax=Pseudomaricurvus sp. HS19 TaxID=2692626 RepID=UPI00136F4FA3